MSVRIFIEPAKIYKIRDVEEITGCSKYALEGFLRCGELKGKRVFSGKYGKYGGWRVVGKDLQSFLNKLGERDKDNERTPKTSD